MSSATTEPVLRTLAPALRALETRLARWLNGDHKYPLSAGARAALDGFTNDLRRQAETLEQERPLLVILLMGGTGVGKSTLLNALAGGAIAHASFARPTTRDPVVYYHESVKPHRLDPALQHCRLAEHDRPALEQKILVDTPDLDSNDLSNREKLHRLLPVADIVLYVGSQEKYHDRLGWELFLEQRQRRAFAFVLNKWDRCVHGAGVGLRPDEDLLRDLANEGFEHPLLFRTCAQHWVDKANGVATDVALPEGEQYQELVHWLEMGLTRLEVEAIKARGVSQLLQQLQRALEEVCPPDLSEAATKTQTAWAALLADEARGDSEVLLNTLEPYQQEIEHHFAQERRQQFGGLMGGYLSVVNRLQYATSALRDRLPFLPKGHDQKAAPPTWDLAQFTTTCSTAASDRHLDARNRALANRLLLAADEQGFPLNLLTEPTERLGNSDWRRRHAQALVEVLGAVEQDWSRPTGVRRYLKNGVILLADYLPITVLLAAIGWQLWRYFDPMSVGYNMNRFETWDLLMPFLLTLMVLVFLHILIVFVLPLRWLAIRDKFERQLGQRLQQDLEEAYLATPAQVAANLAAERRAVEGLLTEAGEVQSWLQQREQNASITSLYGK